MGDDIINQGACQKLDSDINILSDALRKTMDSYSQTSQHYVDSMQRSMNENQYFNQGDLIKLHQNTKNTAISQVCLQLWP